LPASPSAKSSDDGRADLLVFRDWLAKAQYEISVGFAKASLVLSGGALGVSITFVRDIIGEGSPAQSHLRGSVSRRCRASRVVRDREHLTNPSGRPLCKDPTPPRVLMCE
jgi:hypothetical protein